MKITSAEFVKSAFERGHWTDDGLPEIAFLGRSNVGKSSLLNSLLKRKGLARTSNTPGRTQSINFFLVNESFYFVDLPGYGFARVSKTMRSDWGKMAEDYLSQRENLALCIQLVDLRHDPTTLDLQLYEWLMLRQTPYLVVATKADKLTNNQFAKQLQIIRAKMPGPEVIGFSAVTGKGQESLWSEIESTLKS